MKVTGIVAVSAAVPVCSVKLLRDVSNHRRIVGAGDSDLNRAVDSAAVAVVQCNRELLDLGLVLCEILDSGSRNAVIPFDGAAMPSTVSGFTEALKEPSAPVEAVMVGPMW